jgi:hypothetical protein
VPVIEETILTDRDPILEAAVAHLNNDLLPDIADGGQVSIGDTMQGQLPSDTAVEYQLDVAAGDIVDIVAVSEAFDPVVLIFDRDRNLLAANENLNDDTTDAGFKALEIPQDLTLIIWVTSLDKEESGAFTFSVIDASG